MDEPPRPQRIISGPELSITTNNVEGAGKPRSVSQPPIGSDIAPFGPASNPSTGASHHSPGSERWHSAFGTSRHLGSQRWASALGYLHDGMCRPSSGAPSLSGHSSVSHFNVTFPSPVGTSAVATTSTVTTTSMSVSGAGDPVVSSTVAAAASTTASSSYTAAFAAAYQANMNSAINEMLLHQHHAAFIQHQQQQHQAAAMLYNHSLAQHRPSLMPPLAPISNLRSSSSSLPQRPALPPPSPPGVVKTPSPLIITPTHNVETSPQRKFPIIGQIMASPKKEFKPDIQGIISLRAEESSAEDSKLNIAKYYSVEKPAEESADSGVPNTQTGDMPVPVVMVCPEDIEPSSSRSQPTFEQSEEPGEVYMDIAEDPSVPPPTEDQQSVAIPLEDPEQAMESSEKTVEETVKAKGKGKTTRAKKTKAPAAKKRTVKKSTDAKKHTGAKAKSVAKKSTAEKQSRKRAQNVAKKSTTPERSNYRITRRSSRHGSDIVVIRESPVPMTEEPVVKVHMLRGRDIERIQSNLAKGLDINMDTSAEKEKETVNSETDKRDEHLKESESSNDKTVPHETHQAVLTVQPSATEETVDEEQPEEAVFVEFSTTKNHMTDPRLMNLWIDGISLKVISKHHIQLRLYQCSRCAFSHISPQELLNHMQTSHTDHVNPDEECEDEEVLYMKCNHCDFVGYKELSLWYHFSFFHSVSNVLPEMNDRSVLQMVKREHDSDPDDRLTYRCPYSECLESGERPGSVVHHVILEHAAKTDDPYIYDGYTIIQEEDRRNSGTVMVRQVLVCSYCVETVVRTGAADMMKHIYEAHSMKKLQFACTESNCRSQYSCSERMHEHYKKRHQQVKQPACLVSVILPCQKREDPQLFFNLCAPQPIKIANRWQARAKRAEPKGGTQPKSNVSVPPAVQCVMVSDDDETEEDDSLIQQEVGNVKPVSLHRAPMQVEKPGHAPSVQQVEPSEHSKISENHVPSSDNIDLESETSQHESSAHDDDRSCVRPETPQNVQPDQVITVPDTPTSIPERPSQPVNPETPRSAEQPEVISVPSTPTPTPSRKKTSQPSSFASPQHSEVSILSVASTPQSVTATRKSSAEVVTLDDTPTPARPAPQEKQPAASKAQITTVQTSPQQENQSTTSTPARNQPEQFSELSSDSDSDIEFVEESSAPASTPSTSENKPKKVDFCMQTTPYDIDREMRPEFIAPITLSDSSDEMDEDEAQVLHVDCGTSTVVDEPAPVQQPRSRFQPARSNPSQSHQGKSQSCQGFSQSQAPPLTQHAPPPAQKAPPLARQAPPLAQQAAPQAQQAAPLTQQGAPLAQQAPPPHQAPLPPHEAPPRRQTRPGALRQSDQVQQPGNHPPPLQSPPSNVVSSSSSPGVCPQSPNNAMQRHRQHQNVPRENTRRQQQNVQQLPPPQRQQQYAPPPPQQQQQQQSRQQQPQQQFAQPQQPPPQQQQSKPQHPPPQRQQPPRQQEYAPPPQQQQQQQQQIAQAQHPPQQQQLKQPQHPPPQKQQPPRQQEYAPPPPQQQDHQQSQQQQQFAQPQHPPPQHQYQNAPPQHLPSQQRQQPMPRPHQSPQPPPPQFQRLPPHQRKQLPAPQNQRLPPPPQQQQPPPPLPPPQPQQQHVPHQQAYEQQDPQYQQPPPAPIGRQRSQSRPSANSPSAAGRGNFLKSPPNVVEADTTSSDMEVIELDDDEDDEEAQVVDSEQIETHNNQIPGSRKRKNPLRAQILEYLPTKRSKPSEQPSEESSVSFINAYQNFHQQNKAGSHQNAPDHNPGESTEGGRDLPTGPPMLINITPLPMRRKKKGFAKAFERFVDKK